MRFLCLGAGAIGTYIGVSLIHSGEEVTFVGQPASLPRIAENGLSLKTINGSVIKVEKPNLSNNALLSLHNAPVDFIIWAVKSFDNPALIEILMPVADRLPPIISLQNGVENEAQLSAAFGSERIVPMSVCTAISRGERGLVKVEKLRGIGIASESLFAEELARHFTHAGLKPKIVANVASMKWSKMITNLLANATSAILDMQPADIFRDPDGFELEKRQILETLAVMERLSIPVVNLPGTPVKLLTRAIQSLPRFLLQPALVRAVGGSRGGKMPSFHIDLEAGRTRSEVTFLNGAVARIAEQNGMQAPVNYGLTKILTAMAEGSLSRVLYRNQPGKLLQAVLNPTNI